MEDPASLQFDGCLAAQVLYSAVPAASPLNDAWRIRYHPEWVQEREVVRNNTLRSTPTVCVPAYFLG